MTYLKFNIATCITTDELAAALGIGREAARLLMKKTPGVVTLPSLNGKGQRQVRRMPKNVFEAFLVRRGKAPL
jgi:hypothetical protein